MIVVKFGRKRIKKTLPRIFQNLKRFITAQEHMWIIINTAWQKFYKKNKLEKKLGIDVLNVELIKEIEPLDDKFDIEWLIITITAPTKEREEKEFKELDKFNERLKKSYQEFKKDYKYNIEKPKFLDIVKKKTRKVTDKFTEIIKAGIDFEPNKSISDFLLDLDIIMTKEFQWCDKK